MKEKNIMIHTCCSGKAVFYFIDIEISDDNQMKMIRQLSRWYSDTDQDAEVYAEEFYRFATGIMDGMLLLNPRYLLLEEVLEPFLRFLSKSDRDLYKKAFEVIKSGDWSAIGEE